MRWEEGGRGAEGGEGGGRAGRDSEKGAHERGMEWGVGQARLGLLRKGLELSPQRADALSPGRRGRSAAGPGCG